MAMFLRGTAQLSASQSALVAVLMLLSHHRMYADTDVEDVQVDADLAEVIAGEEVVEAAWAKSTSWPGCLENDTVIRSAGQAVFANLEGLGAVSGCFQEDCMNTDKFATDQMESCPLICLSLRLCEFWVWGVEEGAEGRESHQQKKCWFRLGDAGRATNATGWVSGARSCHPPGQDALALGNKECWNGGFDYNACCLPTPGSASNEQCWDDLFDYG
eukprot:CAMPEP_0171109940 /NCGR_PEP_ID=MMETSP0766_2-20121228/71069_1 /TAXON_ID=439317 /ORGANISM="Gambierdiscus australes, Strain CAWD 149" /LENGTH=215 /DNA_ID=CAMNT_0011571745 /DNA_START=54 /DNA_END=698 /DNA_ORIENTATION=-